MLASLVWSACGDDVVCTSELRAAVLVVLTSPEGLPVDSVTAEHGSVFDCKMISGFVGKEASGHYACWEEGGGEYTVRIHSGALVWTRKVSVVEEGDGCHVKEAADITLALTRDSADP